MERLKVWKFRDGKRSMLRVRPCAVDIGIDLVFVEKWKTSMRRIELESQLILHDGFLTIVIAPCHFLIQEAK